ncbi:hypothetical protein, partial [Hydrocarboniphaga effusa]|uniref:hypothetical protein n=1 Tax=Hydrocarboniphaga effusa TaxID=243629 RepID=UPI0035B2A87A
MCHMASPRSQEHPHKSLAYSVKDQGFSFASNRVAVTREAHSTHLPESVNKLFRLIYQVSDLKRFID